MLISNRQKVNRGNGLFAANYVQSIVYAYREILESRQHFPSLRRSQPAVAQQPKLAVSPGCSEGGSIAGI